MDNKRRRKLELERSGKRLKAFMEDEDNGVEEGEILSRNLMLLQTGEIQAPLADPAYDIEYVLAITDKRKACCQNKDVIDWYIAN